MLTGLEDGLLSYQRYGTVMDFMGVGLIHVGQIPRTISPL